jgi:hypothetical protein
MIRRAIRNYGFIEGYKTRVINDFEEHYQWMNQNKPALAILYFANNWNPECSRQLRRDYLNLFVHENFQTFIVETWTGQGERTKKYYSVKYEPSFLFLSDGFELKNSIGGSIAVLKQDLERVKLFRKKIAWSFNLESGTEVWENHHDQYMKRWNEFSEREYWNYEGTLLFDKF